MKKIHVFTSAACNYIPKVRVLVESIRKWHPEWVIHLALSDDLPSGLSLSEEPFDEIHLAAGLDIPDFTGWVFCHGIVELSTAIKPFVLKKLLARDDCAGVVYLDPDTVLFSRLDEVVHVLSSASMALTPHQIEPEASLAAVIDNEICSLKHGIYNLGFIAVAAVPEGQRFAQWWAERTYYFCRDEIPNGIFTDQRWIDLVPAFFEGVCILRTPRLNVAPWNLTTRRLTGSLSDQLLVEDLPLGFYHFTGFDSGDHKLMSNKNAAGNATAAELVSWYESRIAGTKDDPLSRVVWRYGYFTDGTSIPQAARVVYRERLDLQRSYPDPFEAHEGGFAAWWRKQARREYPGLFDVSKEAEELARLRSVVTPGFRGGVDNSRFNRKLMMNLLGQAVFDATQRDRLVRRAWEILRSEGIGGIARRLSA